MSNQSNGSCDCGATQFQIAGKPLLRGFCHCSICQKYNQADYSDITLFKAKDVEIFEKEKITFKSHAFPPIVKRGTCQSCGGASIELLNIPLLPRCIIIPTKNIHQESLIPEPSLHIFYESRKEDVQDSLPKHQGYLSSQIQFSKRLMSALIK